MPPSGEFWHGSEETRGRLVMKADLSSESGAVAGSAGVTIVSIE